MKTHFHFLANSPGPDANCDACDTTNLLITVKPVFSQIGPWLATWSVRLRQGAMVHQGQVPVPDDRLWKNCP
jgi:hypothetical protein